MLLDLGHHSPAVWIGFTAVVGVLLILDLTVVNRGGHALTLKEAARWSGGLVALALLFGLFLLQREGQRAMLEYYAGYLIELSLSVDNLFVFIVLFQYFSVPPSLQPKVLTWGILGALVLRAVMILAGALLLQRFAWITWVFGAILIVTGWRMLTQKAHEIHPERNPFLRLARRLLPVSEEYHGDRFAVRRNGRRMVTPLLLVLLVIEWSDLVFAIDSIPAVFAVTRDPFIVYSSNVFAILGLRALYFVLAGLLDKFRHLKTGVAIILLFVGAKMTASAWVHVPIGLSLAVIIGTLAAAILLSLRPATLPRG